MDAIINNIAEYKEETFTNCGWIKIIKLAIRIPKIGSLSLIANSSKRIIQTLKQKMLSNIFIELRPRKLIKNDWKKAWPPNVCGPIAFRVLPKTDPVSSILIVCTKYFW